MTQEWKLEQNPHAYTDGIIRLFNGVFKKNISTDYLSWKNDRNPAGASIIRLALEENDVIGYTCLWLFQMKLFHEDGLCGQSVDTMVHSDHRRKGIFEKLSLSGVEGGISQNMKINFRFPNHMALSASVNKLGTTKISDIPQYMKILNGFEACKLYSTNPLVKCILGVGNKVLNSFFSLLNVRQSKEYILRPIAFFDDHFDTLWQKAKNTYPIAVARNASYLNWRYKQDPHSYHCMGAYKNEELIGYIVLASEQKKGKTGESISLGHIVDIFCIEDQKDVLHTLYKEAENYFTSQGMCAISCWMFDHWFYGQALTKRGYLRFRSPSVLAALLTDPALDPLRDEIFKKENWFVTIGDSDYI